jgi:hypothetical protein
MKHLTICFLVGIAAFAEGPKDDPPALTDAQRAEYWKAAANLAGAAANFNNAQAEVQKAQVDVQQSQREMERAAAVKKAVENTMCVGFDLDLSGPEPKCKAKPTPANGAGTANPTPPEAK